MGRGFQKITIPSQLGSNKTGPAQTGTPASVKSNNRFGFRKRGKIVIPIFLIVLLISVVLGIAVYLPAKATYDALKESETVAREAYQAAKNQNLEEAQVKFRDLETRLTKVQRREQKLSWLQHIPWVGRYERDANHAISGSIAGVEAVSITIDTLVPYADLLGLKGESTFVAGSADDRIRTAVETLDKIIPNIDKIAEKVSAAQREFDTIDPDRYPEKFRSTQIAPKIRAGKQLFTETASLFIDAQPLLKKVPELLGTREPKRYVVLFQNDKELRATGGFITAYGIFKVDKGKIQVEVSDDIYDLDASKSKKYPAPESIRKYHTNVFTLELRDNNLSPDYMVSMKDFEKMLNDSVTDFSDFDGIIALDTHVLVSTIEILGEFNVYGRKFSAEADPRCDGCPQAVYELEDYSSRPVAYIRQERKDIIGVLLLQIMQKALGVSPSQYWGKLSQKFLDEARQKHILFYFHDKDAQKGIESLNFGGRIMPYEGDYLHINDVNFSGAKSNLFVKHSIKNNVEMSSDGTINRTVTVSYKNPSAASNCNPEAGRLCLNAILNNWVRLYVPKGSKVVEFTGSEKETRTYDELDKTVIEGFLTVKPQAASEIVVRYTLPESFKGNKQYSLLVQKQPGTDGHEFVSMKNGKEVEKFPLITDKEIRMKL